VPQITFYRQERLDGAIRTGLDCDGSTVLESFEPGSPDWDSALLWFVDVRFVGDALPSGSAESVRVWLSNLDAAIACELHRVADEISVGIDKEWPVKRTLALGLEGIEAEVAGSCTNRMTGREFATKLRDIADRWVDLLANLVLAEV
jgi:hypothetical protein